MHYFEFQRFVDSSLPLPTQEGVAAKKARTHGEWSCIVACIPVKIGFSVFDNVVNMFLFLGDVRLCLDRRVYLFSSFVRQVIKHTLTQKHSVGKISLNE